MSDDEAPRVAAGRGDADTGPAHGPGAVAASIQKKLERHGASFGQGAGGFLRFIAIEQALQGAEILKELERVTRLLQSGELQSRPGPRRYAP